MIVQKLLLAALAVTFCTACAQKPEPAPEQTAEVKKEAPAVPQMTQEEMMAKFEKAATPAQNHKLLDQLVGNYKTTAKWWMDPNAKPEVNKGIASKKWIMGGRFLQDEYKGKAMGKPFKGMGLMGYDNAANSYVSVWLDSSSTGVMTSKGTVDETGKVFTFNGEYTCPITGDRRQTREVLRIVDNKTRVFEMFDKDPEGKEFKALEVTYTRQ